MKRIGVISDSHISDPTWILPPPVLNAFQDVELILHAGDIGHISVIEQLETIAPVHAVRGNSDYDRDIAKLPTKKTIEFHGIRIGLMHGYGGPAEIQQTVYREFSSLDPQVVIYGHTHIAEARWESGWFWMNPGSLSLPRIVQYGSVGILIVDGSRINGEIIPLR